MPVTPWLPTVNKIKDGADVSAAVVNVVSSQHVQRAQHLDEKFQELSGKSVLIAYDQPILTSAVSNVRRYSVVFYDREGTGSSANEGVSPALVEFSSTNTYSSVYSPASSSYAMGIVKSVASNRADVYLLGLVELEVDLDDPDCGFLQSDEIDQEAEFLPGPLYLSRTEAGKVTKNPGGIAIYIGYALNRRTFLLAPNVSEFNQFFTTYKFNLLDRPAGIPVLSGTWTVDGVAEVSGDGGINHVGWIPVDALVGSAIESLIPEGAKFYYNLPSDAKILADTGMDSDETLRDEQVLLSRALPPNPTNISVLTINGIIQASRDSVDDGLYVINSAGIWWFADEDGQQPWASDLPLGALITVNASTDEITVPNGNFSLGDKVRFVPDSGATLPAGLAEDTDYYVINRDTSGDDQIIKVSTTVSGSAVNITDTGTGDYFISELYCWKFVKGTDEYRPRMTLQFLKFNPALRESIVTSIKKYNTGSNIISFTTPDKTGEASSGDLLARILLTFTGATPDASSATAVTGLSYTEADGVVTVNTAPVISELVPGSGVTLTPVTVGGVTKPGSYIITASNSTEAGRVSYIEPDGAELLFSGLHSYLNMPPASTLPSSLTGKILLPSNTPDADMTLVIVMLGKSNLSLGALSKIVTFDFSYAVTKPGNILDPTITPTSLSFNIPNATAAYTAKTVFKIGNVSSSTYSIPVTGLKIPSTAFKGGDCSVNFRLTRKTPVSNGYTGDIGIVDIYWKVG